MNNISQIIKQHNKRISKKKEIQTPKCNNRSKNDCPMNGNCKVNSVIYKCIVSAAPIFKQRVYLGIAESDWKQRYYNHKKSFKNIEYRHDTSLSSYLWDLKLKHNEIQSLQWSIVKFAPGYTNISKRCN